jgi:RNA polymerase sigma-70 factor (ECF subfamily)
MTDREFETLFREQFNSLCNLAHTVVKDTDEAKDVVQYVFLNYWQRRKDLTIKGSVKGYFYKAVLNTALTRYNKNKRTLSIDYMPYDKMADNTEPETDNSIFELMHAAINALPPVCQKVFRLSRFTDLSNKEIAEELGISVKAVEKHITKALKALRQELRPFKHHYEIITLPVLIAIHLSFQGVGLLFRFLSL